MDYSNRGLIGATENERAISRWSLSKPIVTQMLEDLHDVVTPNNPKKGGIIDSHKDERPATTEEDQRERLILKEELSKCIH